jgi:CPA1 family monovalent cation:H+ antiporter
MTTFHVVSAVILLVAVFGYFNHRFFGLPDTIGITAIGIIASVAAVVAGRYDHDVIAIAERMFERIDFPETLFHGILGLLLFAGSLHVNVDDIAREKWLILALATLGVLFSTLLVGTGFYAATRLIGVPLGFQYCLLFGALISPTDPIAVLAVLKRLGVPKSLETRIAGESLFNDGTGVVVFLALLGVATSGEAFSLGATAALFATEVVGGLAVGVVAGYLGFLMLRGVDSHPVEILITLALATAGYAAAEAAGVSAPIAVVLMGLIVGNHGKRAAMSEATRQRLFGFWEVLDELLNLLLFGLIGLAMLTLTFSLPQVLAALAAIVIVIASRLLSISGPLMAAPRLREHWRTTLTIMTWGGLRGGISIALALALPAFEGRETVISTTYAVVIFSILVQALSLQRVARRVLARDAR